MGLEIAGVITEMGDEAKNESNWRIGDIEGFLHWGYNFYYNLFSRRKINPYITTSADKAYPSGDPFSVYPIQNGVVPSLRAIVFKEALNDIEICCTLEGYISEIPALYYTKFETFCQLCC